MKLRGRTSTPVLTILDDTARERVENLINGYNNRRAIIKLDWLSNSESTALIVFCDNVEIMIPNSFKILKVLPRGIVDADGKYKGRIMFGCFEIAYKNYLFQVALINESEEARLMIIP